MVTVRILFFLSLLLPVVSGTAYAEIHEGSGIKHDLHGTEMDDPAAANVILPPCILYRSVK